MYNIYNSSSDLYFNREAGTLNILRKILEAVNIKVKYIIINNFNLYYLY